MSARASTSNPQNSPRNARVANGSVSNSGNKSPGYDMQNILPDSTQAAGFSTKLFSQKRTSSQPVFVHNSTHGSREQNPMLNTLNNTNSNNNTANTVDNTAIPLNSSDAGGKPMIMRGPRGGSTSHKDKEFYYNNASNNNNNNNNNNGNTNNDNDNMPHRPNTPAPSLTNQVRPNDVPTISTTNRPSVGPMSARTISSSSNDSNSSHNLPQNSSKSPSRMNLVRSATTVDSHSPAQSLPSATTASLPTGIVRAPIGSTVIPPPRSIFTQTITPEPDSNTDSLPKINLPVHVDKHTFRLQLLLEDGRVIIHTCSIRDTIETIKKTLVEPSDYFPKESATNIRIKIPGAGFLANEHEPVNEIPYFQNCRKGRHDPKLILLSKKSSYYNLVRKDEVTIGSLLGRPLAWAQHDDENNSFRQCMARIRLAERKQVDERKKKLNSLNIPINIGDGPQVPLDIKVFAVLVFSRDHKSKKLIEPSDTAETLLKKHWRLFPQANQGENMADYILRVVGRAEYFAGQHLMYSYEYIQRCVSTKADIELAVTKKSSVESSKPQRSEESTYLFEKEEEFLDVDPVIHYDHEELQKSGDTNISSVWGIDDFFQVKIVSVDSIPTNSDRSSLLLYLHVGVYSGDEEICPGMNTTQVPYDTSAKWNMYAATTVKFGDLPREAKLCFTLYSSKKSRGKSAKIDPIGWVNFLVFNYKNELQVGKFTLKMWPGGSNPTGTCVPNHTEPFAMTLTIDLERNDQLIVFPTEPLAYPLFPVLPPPTAQVKDKLEEIISRHSLLKLSADDCRLVWEHRKYCMQFPKALPKYLISVPKTNRNAVQEMHKLIHEWAPITPVDALELLDAKYADAHIRSYAVTQLHKLCNAEIEDYLLQLVQVLKYECYHDSALSRFLLRSAIRNRRVGHYFYWFLKSELHQPQVSERFGLLLEAFLKGGSEARDDIAAQEQLLKKLSDLATVIKTESNQDTLTKGMNEINSTWPLSNVQLSLDPGFISKGIKVDKCKIMDSKMKPLWLLFQNADPLGDDMHVIFKAGDDLRQDMLTLQMFRIMDKMWNKEGLNLMLNPYGVIAMGARTGMVEVVTRSQTVSKIQKKMGGVLAAWDDEVLFKWLKESNPDELDIKTAVESFTCSCAGYCVATYVLGIGDRHNDNIMVKSDGHLFHIDFGHILGNFKKKWGISRERVPFVFTPDMAFVMGGKNSFYYNMFVGHCMRAHRILRENCSLFINLFAMMLMSGMPELSSKEDLVYLVDTLQIGVISSAQNSFETILEETGNQVSTRVNWFIHNLVH